MRLKMKILTQLAIPPLYWDEIAESWRARSFVVWPYGFLAGGNAPVKLLEYNADTPTSLYESAYFQWLWLEDARRGGIIPRDADQYNAIQERLISRFSGALRSGTVLFFAAVGIPTKTELPCCTCGTAPSSRAGVSVYLH